MRSPVLIVTQCCAKKREVELFRDMDQSVLNVVSPRYAHTLMKGRELLEQNVYGGRSVTALSLYNGFEYKVLDRWLVKERYLKGEIDFIIISAGYGIVHAFERIRAYDAVMKGHVLRLWLSLGLPEIIANYAFRSSATIVYGFLSKTGGYVDIFWKAARHMKSYGLQAKLVSPESCRGTAKVLKAIGLSINKMLRENRIPRYVEGCRINVSDV